MTARLPKLLRACRPTAAASGASVIGSLLPEAAGRASRSEARPSRRCAVIGDSSFSRRKEVKFEGTADYFERNTYDWTT